MMGCEQERKMLTVLRSRSQPYCNGFTRYNEVGNCNLQNCRVDSWTIYAFLCVAAKQLCFLFGIQSYLAIFCHFILFLDLFIFGLDFLGEYCLILAIFEYVEFYKKRVKYIHIQVVGVYVGYIRGTKNT